MTGTSIKQIPFEKAMKLFKKFVDKNSVRPVLDFIYFDGQYFIGTNSHILLRISKDYISDIPEDVVEGSLLNPHTMLLSDNNMNYPDVNKLIPDKVYANTSVLLNDNIKEFLATVKDSKKILSRKKGYISMNINKEYTNIATIEKLFEKRGKVEVCTEHKELSNQIVENVFTDGEEILIHVNPDYIINALQTVKSLSKVSCESVTMNFTIPLRPIHITQNEVFDIIIMPIRVLK